MSNGAGFKLFEQRAGAKHATANGTQAIDWAAILKLILPLILGCFAMSPKTLRRRVLSRARVAAAIRSDRDLGLSWEEAFAAADCCFDVADEATDDECRQFIADCRG